jgi:transmembrane sensor
LHTTAWNWVLRLRDERASPEELAAWWLWYEADARHREAFEEMRTFWQQTGRLVESGRGVDVAMLLADTAPASTSNIARPRAWRRTALATFAAAAAIAVVAVGLTLHQRPIGMSASPAMPLVRESRLSDGSTLTLAANSSVTDHFNSQERVLVMHGNAGEAFFAVAKNPARPFIVKVDDVQVRAVGTAFNIRRANDRVVITVTEGIVDTYLQPHDSRARTNTVRVGAGNEVTWNVAGTKEPQVTPIAVSHATAWQKGRLEYWNEPLASVIADVNRYSQRPVRLADPGIGGILYSGTVFTSDIDAWTQALPRVFPVDVETRADGEVVLVSRTQPGEPR